MAARAFGLYGKVDIEYAFNARHVERIHTNQARPEIIGNRVEHTVDGIRHPMSRRDGAYLSQPDQTARMQFYEDRFADLVAARARIIPTARHASP